MVGVTALILTLLLILDAKTAVSSAREGIELCLSTVVPSLFPFIMLSGVITSVFTGVRSRFLKVPGHLCGIPSGCESLLVTGWLGGYPVGAQSVFQAFQNGQLQRTDAERLLGFCNNAGPAFIFGISLAVFDSAFVSWMLWGVQILSSLIVGIILPGRSSVPTTEPNSRSVSVSLMLIQAVKSMGIICGWVVMARVIIGFLDRLFLWTLNNELAVLLKGSVELSNGCTALATISSAPLRFVICSTMLSFGGLCVWLQTASVIGGLSIKLSLWGKYLQTLISLMLSAILVPVLFPHSEYQTLLKYILPCGIAILAVSVVLPKIIVAFKRKMLYNATKISQKGDAHAFSKEASPFVQLLRLRHKGLG